MQKSDTEFDLYYHLRDCFASQEPILVAEQKALIMEFATELEDVSTMKIHLTIKPLK